MTWPADLAVLAELRRLLADATEAPWRVERDGYHTLYVAGERKLLPGQGRRFQGVAEGPLLDRSGRHWWVQDAALIVALRNHADALLDVAEAAQALSDDEESQEGGWGPDVTMLHPLHVALARLDGKETPR